jgi:hypothetical protein
MSDPRRQIINALSTLFKGTSAVTDVVKEGNIVMMTPPDGKIGEVRPRINIKPGELERDEEQSDWRVWKAEVFVEMSVDFNEYDTMTIFDILDVVVGNKDAAIFLNDSRLTGLAAGDTAQIVEESEVEQPVPVVDVVKRVVTAELSIVYIYHQFKN